MLVPLQNVLLVKLPLLLLQSVLLVTLLLVIPLTMALVIVIITWIFVAGSCIMMHKWRRQPGPQRSLRDPIGEDVPPIH